MYSFLSLCCERQPKYMEKNRKSFWRGQTFTKVNQETGSLHLNTEENDIPIGRVSLARENEAGGSWGQEVHILHVNV